ncbi:MAG TPA: amidase [Trebonia sp.]
MTPAVQSQNEPLSPEARSALVGDLLKTSRRAADASGSLVGTSFAVKDLIDLRGWPTGAGRVPPQTRAPAATDAPIVARFKSAGAVAVAKTRTDELGLATFSPGVINPFDRTRSVGGSSGGSAVAVATGLVGFALATDTAGSARIPAAAAGVVGLCLPAGWESRDGVVGLSETFDRLGVITSSCDRLVSIMAGMGDLPGRGDAQRIWTLSPDTVGRVDPHWARAADEVARRVAERWDLELAGPLDVEPLSAFGAARGTVITADAVTRHRAADATTDVVRAQLEAGAKQDHADVAAARRELARLGAQYRNALGPDLLVMPTLPSAPPRWSDIETVPDQLRAIGWMTRLCAPANSSALVSTSIPYGVDPDGLPIGVQLIAADLPLVLAATEACGRECR